MAPWGGGVLVWAVYFFSPLHRHFMQRRGDYKRVLLPLLGLVALGFAAAAVVTGEVWMSRTGPVLRTLEPGLYWRYVGIQAGGGCLLILVGFIYPKSRH